MEPAATEAEPAFSQSAAVLVAALFVWGTSVVRVVGTFVYQERFGAESTLALLMALLMSRVLLAPLTKKSSDRGGFARPSPRRGPPTRTGSFVRERPRG